MADSDEIPLQIAGYNILLLCLPPLPSFPQEATHYLYVAPHQPKVPSATASRSLFLVNIPFDATEAHFKYLFSTQLGLSAGRVEDVQFESQRRKGRASHEGGQGDAEPFQKGNKRKRESNGRRLENLKGAEFPSTWDREIHIDGLTAVVIFVDRASMDAAMKAVKNCRQEGNRPVWGEGMEGKIPPLGSASSFSSYTQMATTIELM